MDLRHRYKKEIFLDADVKSYARGLLVGQHPSENYSEKVEHAARVSLAYCLCKTRISNSNHHVQYIT